MSDLSPSFFVGYCRFLAYPVNSSVDVSVVMVVESVQRFDDLDWFLGGCSVVEINNGSPVDFALENWKLGSYPLYVVPASLLDRVDLGVALHGLSSDREDRNIVEESLCCLRRAGGALLDYGHRWPVLCPWARSCGRIRR